MVANCGATAKRITQTAKVLTDTATLKRIDIVEISHEILEMSSIVYPHADNLLHDPPE